MIQIHPTAIVSPEAVIGEGTKVGPYAVIDDKVTIGKNCDIQAHAVIRSQVTLGDEVAVHPFSVLGGAPQHLGYKGEPTTVTIGNRVVLRESTTVHRGMPFDKGNTTIGDDCYIMAYSHIAHDCTIGKGVILANAIQLAGHVTIGDFVTIGGLSGIAQWCRVGMYCYLGGNSVIRKDVPPFLVGKGADFEVQGINVVGLERRGFNVDTIQRLRKLYKIFYLQNLSVAQATDKVLAELGQTDEVKVFLDFIQTSKVGFER